MKIGNRCNMNEFTQTSNYNETVPRLQQEERNQREPNPDAESLIIKNIIQLLYHLEKIWKGFKIYGNDLLERYGGYAIFDKISILSKKHPYLSISAALILLLFLLPFTIILIFALSTIVMTFTGFVLLEGTLITIASVLLFGCLGVFLITFLFFISVVIAGYFGFKQIYEIYNQNNNTETRNSLNTQRSS